MDRRNPLAGVDVRKVDAVQLGAFDDHAGLPINQ
jgi:hypothetical protein